MPDDLTFQPEIANKYRSQECLSIRYKTCGTCLQVEVTCEQVPGHTHMLLIKVGLECDLS